MKKNRKFKSKPSYDLYIQLWYTLDSYLMTRIDTYIYFEYYKWVFTEKRSIGLINMSDIYIKKYNGI